MYQAPNVVVQPARDAGPEWFIIMSGFLPVLSIVMHCLGLVTLHVCLFAVVLPAFTIVIIFGIKTPALGKVMLSGWGTGVIAVSLYDLSRVPFILNGWDDFIPKIGAWLTNDREHDVFLGYLWRYAGNGGGMGVAFFVLLNQLHPAKRIILSGIAFGLGIFVSLICVLVIFKDAQEMMFKVSAFTLTGSFIGHAIYGLALGFLAKKFREGDYSWRTVWFFRQ